MAAVVVGGREETVFGNKRVVIFNVSSVDDTDTLVTGLQDVDFFIFTPQTAVAVGGTIVGGTITFKVAAGTLAGNVLVVGT